MDTTLRDGEQTSGVAYTDREKLQVSKLLLEEVQVDRIEIASARVSSGEMNSVERIVRWADEHRRSAQIEVLAFIDGGKSIEWIEKTGAGNVNLLCKGSLKHLTLQLRKTPARHIDDIRCEVERARSAGMKINVYLEDWSNGMCDSKDYVFELLDALTAMPVERIMLPDTLGTLTPDKTFDYCSETCRRHPFVHFDFHAHNDYDLAVANSLAAVNAGVKGIHTTVNGLGERAGNTPLASIIAVLKDHSGTLLNVDEHKLINLSKTVERFSGVRIPTNKPVVGKNIFTQTCGVHADGDNKGDLYHNSLSPERFGRTRTYALGKTSGKANIRKNLEELGIAIESEQQIERITERVIELGDRKEIITTEDLRYIALDMISNMTEQRVKVCNYSLNVANGLRPSATLKLEIDGEKYEKFAPGDGQYDAFMNALRIICAERKIELPELTDYIVTIPPGGHTDALVETAITWKNGGKEFKTRGLDSDQTVSAIKATVKMLNLVYR
jgi:D-citramalate synthase